MQIVIDIDKEDYKDINDIHFIREDLKFKIGKAIMNGIPLPKGHGKLIDVGQCGGADSLITVKSAFDMLLSLPTIIEADKAESEG